MKDIIESYNWKEYGNLLFIKPHKHFGISGNAYLKLRENFENGTHITVRFFREGEEKAEYMFQGWLLEETSKEFKKLMKQLRIWK